MKNLQLVFLTIASLGVLPATMPAQPAKTAAPTGSKQTATITGRVQNSATGQYLPNARVTLKGSNLSAFTDELGRYQIAGAPAGPVVLEVFFTGLDQEEIQLNAGAGEVVVRDVALTSVERYGTADATVQLDPFVISSGREMEGESLATNEQRFAANIKNVVSTDSLGTIVGDSVGQFLRFLPGLTPEGSGEVVAISVRGLPSAQTGVSVGGMPTISESDGAGNSRTVNLLSFSLNNISRIEVTKVPTPSSPADSLAGTINMVPKSAFERSGAQFRYSLHVLGSSREFKLDETPHPDEKTSRKLTPGFDFDYTLPVNKNLGVVLTGMYTNRYTFQSPLQTIYHATGNVSGVSPSAPYLRQVSMNDFPRNIERKSGSIRIDWKATTNSVLSAGFQYTQWRLYNINQNWVANAGTNGNPTPASGIPLTYGDDFTIGATGRGAVSMTPTHQRRVQPTRVANLTYRFDNGQWKIDANAGATRSRASYRNFEHGRFYSANVTMIPPFRVEFHGRAPHESGIPASVRVFNNANEELSIFDPANYRLNTVRDHEFDKATTLDIGKIDVRRRLDLFDFPFSVQGGGLVQTQSRDATWKDMNYTFNGVNGNRSLTPFVTQVDTWDADVPGYRGLPVVSMHRIYDAWQQNPDMFTQTPAQIVSAEQARITNSEALEETVSSLYLQAEARLFSNRLLVLAGVRFEKTDVEGVGGLFDPAAAFERDASGNFLRNASGARIRKLEAGAAGSLDELRLTRQERAFTSARSYDGYYPSVHSTYSITENLLLRAAYAATYGRPNFANIIPRATINESDLSEAEMNDPSALEGTIEVRNTGLQPWSADNFDLTLEHYAKSGGMASVGLFQKQIEDFFDQEVRIATLQDLQELGLDPRHEGWEMRTQFNGGKAKITGIEINLRQPLRPLGEWARHLMVFANGTKLKQKGRDSDFGGFIPETANWGISYNGKRMSVMAKWYYRGEITGNLVAALGPDARQYDPAMTRLDLNLGYQVSPRLRLAASFLNLTNEPLRNTRYGPETPGYARNQAYRDQGIAISLSMQGKF